MKLTEKLLSYPARWRRSRGFGVHSPFAYSFITKVLREKDAEYYAYAEIAAFCPRARRAGFNEIFAGRDMSVPEAHMLFRVLCHFNPAEIIEIGHGHEVTNVILERAVPRAKVTTWHPETPMASAQGSDTFVLINQIGNADLEHVERLLETLLATGTNTVVTVRNIATLKSNMSLWRRLTETPDFGMCFYDNYTGIYVGRRTLPRQNYEIIL